MVNIPNFSERERKLTPVSFVSVEKVFKPMVEVIFNKDVSGWVGGTPLSRKRWAFSHGKAYAIDSDKAREFTAKGYCDPTSPLDPPLSPDEIAEYKASVTTLSMGRMNG